MCTLNHPRPYTAIRAELAHSDVVKGLHMALNLYFRKTRSEASEINSHIHQLHGFLNIDTIKILVLMHPLGLTGQVYSQLLP